MTPADSGRGTFRRQSDRADREGPNASEQRLQKVLAYAGIASRRESEELILQGRVEVDGRVVDELGTRVDPEHQEIRVDGQPVRYRRRQYWLVHKPRGVVSTNDDPAGRPRVVDLVDSSERLFTVGRLDKSSSGLMLVTNDGDLANRLAHPRYHVTKTYLVTVAGEVDQEAARKLRKGIYLAEGKANIERLTVRRRRPHSTVLEMVLAEGRNREVRRLLARVGHKVMELVRTAIGPVKLGSLPPGAFRPVTREELEMLRAAARGQQRIGRRKPRRSGRKTGKRPVVSRRGTVIR